MATLILSSSSWDNGEIRITYTASNGTLKITEIEGKRGDGYRSYNENDTAISVSVGGTSKSISLSHYVDFGASSWVTWGATDTSWTGLSGNSISVSTTMQSGTPAYSGYTFSGSATMSWTKYTIAYNANGGSGAPSSQTKTHGTNLTLSSTKPTKTGYTFKGWALTKADADDGTWYYQAGGTCGKNEDLTLYAVWEENCLTISYYSNYATSAFADAENTVGADKNVKVHTTKVYYDNDYSTYGLANYSGSGGSVYMTRTGYTATKYWGTSTSGGTLVHEDTGYATGQALAKALGKDLSSGDASINVYAQWQENALTVNLYSNYADYGTYQGEKLNVSSNTNVVVYTKEYLYDNAYSDGLSDIQNSNYLYLTRTGHASTGYWGTSTSGGTLVDEKKSFATGQALAEVFGKSLKTGNATVNLYAQWKPNTLTIKYNVNGGKISSDKYCVSEGLVYYYSTLTVLEDKWTYNSGHADGLYNAKTFGLTREGYKFVGWKVGSSGNKVFDQDDFSVVPTDLASNLTTGDRTVTLYAVWEISGVVYIDNGTKIEPYHVYIDNGNNWDLYLIYIDNGTDWDIAS